MPAKKRIRPRKQQPADVGSVTFGPASLYALEELAARPEMVIALIDQLISADAQADTDDDSLAASLILLGRALEVVRYGVEAGRHEDVARASEVRRHLIAAHTKGAVSPALMLLILGQLVAARLDVGAELQSIMLGLIEANAAEAPVTSLREGAEGLQDLARELKGNPFDIHEYMKDLAEALPEAAQAQLALALLAETEEGLAQAALGFLLSPSDAVREQVGRALESSVGALATRGDAPVLLRRLIALRNWLSAPERAPIDAAIKGLRQRGVECASWAKPGKMESYATGFDGSGMQSVFLIAKEGRKHAIAALIGRLGSGVRDAWVRRGASKRDVDDALGSGEMMGGLAPVAMAYVAEALRQFLAANAASGSQPPFGLLEFAECAGLAGLVPERADVGGLIERLCREIEPEHLAAKAVEDVLADSASWPEQFELLQSWFEAGDKVAALLAGNNLSRKKQVSAVLAGPVAADRRRWAEMLVWKAMFARAITHAEAPWREFAIVARELLGHRPLAQIGLMSRIAEQTVYAHLAR